jgi:glycosyltransferase involved in cell wall biosynthesis
MKVALFVHCFFPEHFYGTETYTLQVAKRLREMGHEAVVVAAVFQGEAPRAELVTRYTYEGVPVLLIDKNKVPHRTIRETYYQPEMAGVFREILRDVRPDLLHVTHLINHTAVLLEVADELGLPTVGTLTDFFGFCYTNKLVAVDGSICHGPSLSRANCVACHLYAENHPSGRGGSWWRTRAGLVSLLARFLVMASNRPHLLAGHFAATVGDLRNRPEILAGCYRHYDVVVTPTRFLRRAYQRNGLGTPCVDIRFGVDIDRKPKPPHRLELPLRVGYIGQIAPHKGVDLLVKAMAGLPPGAARLDIFGPKDQDPRYMSDLQAIAAELPVAFRGTFSPERMADTLRDLDLMVIPSRWPENSPLVLLDALATHTPVIVSDVEGLTEFVEDGKNGFAIRRGSVKALGEQLMRFVEDRTLAARMSESTYYGRTSRNMVEDLLPVYARALLSARRAQRDSGWSHTGL